MSLDALLGWGLLLYVIGLVAAHVYAWRDRIGVALALVAGVLAVPVTLFVIGSLDNSSHGTGLYGLDLMMLLATPVATLLSVGWVLSCLGMRALGRRERAGDEAGGETLE